MRKFLLTILSLTIFTTLSQTSHAAAKGQIVAAKWSDSSWYIAMVTNVVGAAYDVIYADGDSKQGLAEADIKALPDDPALKVGDKVLAVWNNSKLYPGTVTNVCNLSYEIKWDDNSAPKWVPAGKILKQ